MPIGPARMPLMDHLSELRMRFVRIVVVLIIALSFFYVSTPTICQFLLQPVSSLMPHDAQGNIVLNVFGAFDAFSVRIQVSLWTSLVACMPFILWQVLAFFLPALKPKERKWFLPTFFVAVALFILGTIFCYCVILYPAFQFLTDQASGFATIMPEATQWIDIIVKFELGFGLAFELPLIVFYLTIFDVVPYVKLRGMWREVYVALLVISAVVTPDASPVTMLLMFAAMLALYEISLFASRMVLGRDRIREQKEEMARQKAEDEEWKRVEAEKKAKRAGRRFRRK